MQDQIVQVLYSSKDMVNWTDHGAVASLATFPWARQDNGAWAAQAIERNGKFYLGQSAPLVRQAGQNTRSDADTR